MSKITLAGFIFCAGGIVMAIFEAIQSTMTAGEINWAPVALVDIVDEARFAWIDNLSAGVLRNILDVFVTLPVFGLVVGIGVILLILGGLAKK
jgi:hypothetical protein